MENKTCVESEKIELNGPEYIYKMSNKYLTGEKKTKYIDLLKNGKIKRLNESCEKNFKNCGKIDTLGQKLCLSKEEECPIQDFKISNKEIKGYNNVEYQYNQIHEFISYSNKTFYGNAKTYPIHHPFIVAHTSNQVAFNGRKGYNQIIEALKILKEKDVAVKVRFAGRDYQDGINRLNAYAQQLGVAEMVEFVGFLNRKELDSFLSDADMYVMPTMAEGLPRVIIEAMSKGLPCITTPVSGNPELVSSYFLVDYYDTQTLAGRIEELTTSSQLYEQTSKENYLRSLQYEASVLEKRRDGFYGKLRALVS